MAGPPPTHPQQRTGIAARWRPQSARSRNAGGGAGVGRQRPGRGDRRHRGIGDQGPGVRLQWNQGRAGTAGQYGLHRLAAGSEGGRPEQWQLRGHLGRLQPGGRHAQHLRHLQPDPGHPGLNHPLGGPRAGRCGHPRQLRREPRQHHPAAHRRRGAPHRCRFGQLQRRPAGGQRDQRLRQRRASAAASPPRRRGGAPR